MSTLRELKTRIGSVSSSEKITGAMKMISSAKVRKFEQSLKRLLPFKTQIKSIMGHLLDADGQYTSPLLEERGEVNTVGVVVYGSDDGLCGAYNMNIFNISYLPSILFARSMAARSGLSFSLLVRRWYARSLSWLQTI